MSRVGQAARAVMSMLCWTLSVIVMFVSIGAFFDRVSLCALGAERTCAPPTLVLVGGAGLATGLGVVAALLWKPKPRKPPPGPWEYRS